MNDYIERVVEKKIIERLWQQELSFTILSVMSVWGLYKTNADKASHTSREEYLLVYSAGESHKASFSIKLSPCLSGTSRHKDDMECNYVNFGTLTNAILNDLDLGILDTQNII